LPAAAGGDLLLEPVQRDLDQVEAALVGLLLPGVRQQRGGASPAPRVRRDLVDRRDAASVLLRAPEDAVERGEPRLDVRRRSGVDARQRALQVREGRLSRGRERAALLEGGGLLGRWASRREDWIGHPSTSDRGSRTDRGDRRCTLDPVRPLRSKTLKPLAVLAVAAAFAVPVTTASAASTPSSSAAAHVAKAAKKKKAKVDKATLMGTVASVSGTTVKMKVTNASYWGRYLARKTVAVDLSSLEEALTVVAGDNVLVHARFAKGDTLLKGRSIMRLGSQEVAPQSD
jgi:hypothetical protein